MPAPAAPATVRLLPHAFAGVGLVMLVVTVWLNVRERSFAARAARATGIVTELERGRGSSGGRLYYPVIGFLTASGDSVSFRSSIGSSPPSYQPGEAVTVLYDPADPTNARIAGFFSLHLGSFITSLLTLIFGGIGGIWLKLRRRAAAFAEEKRRSGRRIQAQVVDIERRTNIRVGNRHPYRIVAQWHDPATGAVRISRSANIWFDPREYVGETVDVLVDVGDPRPTRP
jgi:hypothetical protein